MLQLSERLDSLQSLAKFLLEDNEEWQDTKRRANDANGWFTVENIDFAVKNICEQYLNKDKLNNWLKHYEVKELLPNVLEIGIIMAGNIPLVGFHDFLCVYVSGNIARIKLSGKDTVLWEKIIDFLHSANAENRKLILIEHQLKNCSAFIATGSNNSSRYFEKYFADYPHIIRKNRTSVAILKGDETSEELQLLIQDIHQYFGLGCRNVTQLWIPKHYKFNQLLEIAERNGEIIHHHKYKNNYDYQFAIYLLNKVPFLTNDSLLLVENAIPFSAVSVLHYYYYNDINELNTMLNSNDDIQAIVCDNELKGIKNVGLGTAQIPKLDQYADGIDTMKFLINLNNELIK